MTADSAQYTLHGIPLTVLAESRWLLDAAGELLRPFATAGDVPRAPTPGIAVELLTAAPPEAPPTGARIWMEVDGLRLLADDDASYLVYDEVYRGRLAHCARRITFWIPAADALDAWSIAHLLLQPLLLEALRPDAFVAVHAAALVAGGAAVLFPAASGSGKTTLALSLLRAGFHLLSDDSPLLRCDDGLVTAYAFPEPLQIAAPTAALFPEVAVHLPPATGAPWTEKAELDARAIYGSCLGERAPVRAVVFPVRGLAAGVTHVSPLPKAQALLRLLPLTMTSATPAQTRAQFQLLAQLIHDTPCYQMEAGGDFDRIPALIYRLLAGEGAK